MKALRQNLRKDGLCLQAIILAGFEVFLFAAMAPFLWCFGPAAALRAAGVAAGLCLAGALLSLGIHYIFRDPQSVLISTLLGMGINMGIPLVFGAAIQLRGGPLSQAGFLYYLVLFYLLTLAVKTMLTLPLRQPTAIHNNPT
jgi:hypothetical protein